MLEIREEVVRTLFHAEIEVEEADQLEQAQAAQAPTATGSRTRTSRSPARRRSPPRAAARRSRSAATAPRDRGALDAGGGSVMTAAARDERPREDRPQRPVLVRQRQEVQALPRRAGRLPALSRLATRRRCGRARWLRPRRRAATSPTASSSRRSGPSSPGSVITFDPDQLESRVAELEQELGAPGSGTTSSTRRRSAPSTRA